MDMDAKRVAQVDGLTVRFSTPSRVVEAVSDVSFHVDRGETLAIVGESGSGKSVTSLALMRLVEYGGGTIAAGNMRLRRRNGDLLELARADESVLRRVRGADIAMIFQEPMTSLNPSFTAGVQIAEALQTWGDRFEAAVRVGLKAILVSPEFLFLRERVGKLDDFALASRLSYFLWSTIPDDELFKLAQAGTLSRPEVLRAQVNRMLDSPKARQFTENFCGQWLGLRDIDFTAPDFLLYPEFDEALKTAMVDEAHLFFVELLRHDLGVSNLVASDFTFLNSRLARHYGIVGIDGMEMRKAKLPPNRSYSPRMSAKNRLSNLPCSSTRAMCSCHCGVNTARSASGCRHAPWWCAVGPASRNATKCILRGVVMVRRLPFAQPR